MGIATPVGLVRIFCSLIYASSKLLFWLYSSRIFSRSKFYNTESELSDWQKLLKTCQLNQSVVVFVAFVALCVLKCSWLPYKRVCNGDFQLKKVIRLLKFILYNPHLPTPVVLHNCWLWSVQFCQQCACVVVQQSPRRSPPHDLDLSINPKTCARIMHTQRNTSCGAVITLEQWLKC